VYNIKNDGPAAGPPYTLVMPSELVGSISVVRYEISAVKNAWAYRMIEVRDM